LKFPFNTQPENVRIEQVRSLYKQSGFLIFGLIAAIVIIAVHFWGRVDPLILKSWVVANFTLAGLRFWMIKRFWQINPQKTAIKWGYFFMATSMVSGLIMGVLPIFILDLSDIMGILLVSTIFTGMVAGSLVTLSCFMPTHSLFSIFTLGPFIYLSLLDNNPVINEFGIILFIYLLVMLVFSFIVNRSMTESILLRFENLDLVRDLRRQKKLAEQASSDKSRFLAATSHDLRQPLHALDLYLGALKNRLTTTEQTELLEKSSHSSHALGELLNALMDISRLDAGNIEVKLTTFDVQPLLRQLVDEFQPLANEKNMLIELQETSFYIESDRVLFSRIIRNLLSNAIKHNDYGNIVITLEEHTDSIHICVKDQGKGISETELDNIFSEFYQLDNPERDRTKGLGLGLAIVKRLSRLLSHPVKVKSQPKLGSCFSVQVPKSSVISQVSTRAQQPTFSAQEKLPAGLFVVCVDDELSVRDALRVLLRSWDCEVLLSDSEQQIIEELKAYNYPRPDIIISDYRLRENKNGVQVIKAICQYYHTTIASIIMTGDTTTEIRQQAKSINSEIMFKPVEADMLLQKLIFLSREPVQADMSGTADTE